MYLEGLSMPDTLDRWEPKLCPLCHSFTTACTRTNCLAMSRCYSPAVALHSHLTQLTCFQKYLNALIYGSDQSTNTNNNAVMLV